MPKITSETFLLELVDRGLYLIQDKWKYDLSQKDATAVFYGLFWAYRTKKAWEFADRNDKDYLSILKVMEQHDKTDAWASDSSACLQKELDLLTNYFRSRPSINNLIPAMLLLCYASGKLLEGKQLTKDESELLPKCISILEAQELKLSPLYDDDFMLICTLYLIGYHNFDKVFVQEFRRKQGLCLYCGGKLKGLISKKCSVCGKPNVPAPPRT